MDTLVFMSGNSQAIRIPKEFQIKSKVVEILRKDKELIIREKKPQTWDEIFAMPDDKDFYVERDNSEPQKRGLF